MGRGTDLAMQAPDGSTSRRPLFPARKRLFIASLLFAFLFPCFTWKQAADCALLLLLFNTLILPWLDVDVSKRIGVAPPPPGSLLNQGGGSSIPAGHTYPAPTPNKRAAIILYPISVLALILLCRNHLAIAAAAWAIMALGDSMATVIGEAVPLRFVAGRQAQKATAEILRFARNDKKRAQNDKGRAQNGKLRAQQDRPRLGWLCSWQPRGQGIAATLPWNRQKTWAGFLSFVIAGTTGAGLLTRWTAPEVSPQKTLIVCAAAALLGAVCECLPIALDDNVTVPLVVGVFMFCAFLVERSALDSNLPYLGRRLVLAIAVSLAFAWLAYALQTATRSGAVCGFLLATAIYLGYGYRSFLPLFAFVVLGSVATRLGLAKKTARGAAAPVGGARSWREALANLLAPAFFAILVITTHHEAAFLIALVAALAEAAGDTVSSEIGQWASNRAYLITTFKLVPAGEEGGVSLAGTAAGFAASAIIMGLALELGLCGPYRFAGSAVALGAAVAGNLCDSFLGATIQRRGLITNGLVNFAGTSVAGGLALGLALHLGL
jgi:uncharacterized protein (TIGR00297 family)